MFSEREKRKNFYIHSIFPGENPLVLNKFVDDAFEKTSKSCSGAWKDNKLASSCLAYSSKSLKKLIFDISDLGVNVDNKLLQALSDKLKNKENCFRAMNHYRIVPKLNKLIIELCGKLPDSRSLMEPALDILETIAINHCGATMISEHENLLEALYDLILNNEILSCQAARVLKEVSRHSNASKLMVERNYLEKSVKLSTRNEDSSDVFEFLFNLIKSSPLEALRQGLFELLRVKALEKFPILPESMKCFAVLINNEEGQKLCDRHDVIYKLYKILRGHRKDPQTLQYTVLALQNATLSTKSLWRCRELWDLPLLLVKAASSTEDDLLQLYALQTLYQITQMPVVKDFVRKVCKSKITRIPCRKLYCEEVKQRLLVWLRRKPYKNIQIDSLQLD